MENILIIHQSASLYGSDRVLLALLTNLDRDKYHPIVLLPVHGLLQKELIDANIECHIIPFPILTRALLSKGNILGLLKLPMRLGKSIFLFNSVLNGRKIILVHSNTLAVFSGALWAYLYRVPHIWHVHEIITSPKIVSKVYSFLLYWITSSV